MSELADAVGEAVEEGSESKLNTRIAAFVAVTATFLALCNLQVHPDFLASWLG